MSVDPFAPTPDAPAPVEAVEPAAAPAEMTSAPSAFPGTGALAEIEKVLAALHDQIASAFHAGAADAPTPTATAGHLSAARDALGAAATGLDAVSRSLADAADAIDHAAGIAAPAATVPAGTAPGAGGFTVTHAS